MSAPNLTLAPISRDQSLYSLIASIALQEAALSHLLNADGEKLQMAVALIDPQSKKSDPRYGMRDLLRVNDSVNGLINIVRTHEDVLREKLHIAVSILDSLPPDPEPEITCEVTFAVITADTLHGLSGARFGAIMEIAGDAAGRSFYATSDIDGLVTLNLPAGTYTMRQSRSVEGYRRDPTEYTIVVNAEDCSYTINGEPGEEFPPILNVVSFDPPEHDVAPPVINDIFQPSEYCLTIHALSNNTSQPVPNASFQLWHEGAMLAQITADPTGALRFGSFPPGIYTLRQTGALAGWQDVPDMIVEVSEDGGWLPSVPPVHMSEGLITLNGSPSMKVMMSRTPG